MERERTGGGGLELEELTERIIGSAIEVHREVGPGALESTYEGCLAHELALRGLGFARQVELPVVYKGTRIDCGYRIDMLVEGLVVVELKAVDRVLPIHEAQLLTYLKLGRFPVGLLINFNVPRLIDGLTRRASTRQPPPPPPLSPPPPRPPRPPR